MTAKKTVLRIAKWIGLVAILLLALLLLAAWLVNREPFQKKLRVSVQEKTGDRFTFQTLRFSLLPRPRVTLENPGLHVPGRLSVTMKYAFIYPDVLPLFKGNVRIAKAHLEMPEVRIILAEEPGAEQEDPKSVFEETRAELESATRSVREIGGDFSAFVNSGTIIIRNRKGTLTTIRDINGSISLIPRGFDLAVTGEGAHWGAIAVTGSVIARRNSILVRNLSLSGGKSTISGVSARFRWKKSPYLQIRSGQAAISLQDLYERRAWISPLKEKLRTVQGMTGLITFKTVNFIGPLLHPKRWTMLLEGSLEQVLLKSSLVPGPVSIENGAFTATTSTLSLTDVDAAFMDASFTTTVSLSGSINRIRAADVTVRGRFGRNAIRWAGGKFNAADIHGPLTLKRLHFTWKRGSAVTLAASASAGNGSAFSIAAKKSKNEFVLEKLTLEDDRSNAALTFTRNQKFLDAGFRGLLYENTLNKILDRSSVHQGRLRGDIRVHLPFDRPGESTAKGRLMGEDLFFQIKGTPVTVKKLDLLGENRSLTVKKASVVWGVTPLDLFGRFSAARDGVSVTGVVDAGKLDMQTIVQTFQGNKKDAPPGDSTPEAGKKIPVTGSVRVNAKEILFGRYRFSPVKGDVFLDRNSTRIELAEANLCGISLPGHLQPLGGDFLLDLTISASDQPLEPALACLFVNKRITGTFTLSGRLHAKGKSAELVKALQGTAQFRAKDGKIYRYPLLSRIFAFLNVTELLRGKLPDLGRDGFAFKKIEIRGDIKNGRLLLSEAALEGATLNLAADGWIDFGSNTMDVTVLVAPFKTIEYLLSKIPFVRKILANKLVTVPIRLTGDLNHPDVKPLDPEATGEHVLEIMKGILELPFRVLDPLFGRDKK